VSDSNDQEFDRAAELPSIREGLPRQYQMRADRHYVDQMAQSAGDPVRMIPVNQLNAEPSDVGLPLRPLIESIRLHGVVHPLLVRRRETGYHVIAGRKRLTAAKTLQFTTVPCLVHDVTDAEMEALAAADNVRTSGSVARDPGTALLGAVPLLSAHMSGIAACAVLCGAAAGGLQQHALDLLKVHAWRAGRLVEALTLLSNAAAAPPRARSIAGIIDEVVEGFAVECRLASVTLRVEVREALSSAGLNDRQIAAGLAGALMAVLPLVANTVRPTIVIHAANTNGNEIVIEVIQHNALVTPHAVERFFDSNRPQDDPATIGALAVKALAEAHDGRAVFEALSDGSRLAITMKRRS
jgi:ParB-like chromosome segregation protein Spo0J